MSDSTTKKPIYKRAWFIILVVIVIVGAISTIGSSDTPTSKGANETKKEKEVKTEFNQSETASYKDVDFTITSVEKSSGSEFDTPKSGHEYVIVSVLIQNNSDEKVSYNALDWKMLNSNGNETDGVFTIIDSDTNLNSGDLASGGKIEGTLVYEQPIDDTGLKLNYYDSLFSDKPIFTFLLNGK